MNNQPLRPGIQTHIYEIWSNEHEPIAGTRLDFRTEGQCNRLYDYCHKIEGRQHRYIFYSHEPFTREAAVSFAKALYENKVRRLHIDLSGIGR